MKVKTNQNLKKKKQMKVIKDIFKEEVFQLYKKVLQDNELAKKEFVRIYNEKYPFNSFISTNLNKEHLHIMYLHLYQ